MSFLGGVSCSDVMNVHVCFFFVLCVFVVCGGGRAVFARSCVCMHALGLDPFSRVVEVGCLSSFLLSLSSERLEGCIDPGALFVCGGK